MAAAQLSQARRCLRFCGRKVAGGPSFSRFTCSASSGVRQRGVFKGARTPAAFKNSVVHAPAQSHGQYKGSGNKGGFPAVEHISTSGVTAPGS